MQLPLITLICPLSDPDGHRLSSAPPPFLIRCKQGTLQFVILKPILATLSLILFTLGLLDIGDPSPFNGWIYIAIALNITYSIALTSLLQFYLGTRELLAVSREEEGGAGTSGRS